MNHIRALTCFLNPRKWGINELRNYLEERFSRLKEALDIFLEKHNVRLWTFRIALPYTPHDVNLEDIAKLVEELAEIYSIDFISAIHLREKDHRITGLADILESYERVFASIKVDTASEALKVSKIYNSIEGFAGAKLAIHVGPELITPYFPLAKNVLATEGLSLTSFVINELKNAIKKRSRSELVEVFKEAERFGIEFSKEANISYFGVDTSPSPWMDLSIAEVIELASGSCFGEYGTHWGISRIMNLIKETAAKVNIRTTGFNEIMLPLAEDNLLKVRAVEGKYGVKDLLSYISVCVSGLDMVPVAKPLNYKVIAKLILDLKSLAEVKGRSLGLRLIPITADPGSIIELKMFGKVPVLKL